MGARLEGDVQGRPAGARGRVLERDDLGVRAALSLVPAFADDGAVADNHGANHGVRRCRSTAPLGKLERALQMLAVSLRL